MGNGKVAWAPRPRRRRVPIASPAASSAPAGSLSRSSDTIAIVRASLPRPVRLSSRSPCDAKSSAARDGCAPRCRPRINRNREHAWEPVSCSRCPPSRPTECGGAWDPQWRAGRDRARLQRTCRPQISRKLMNVNVQITSSRSGCSHPRSNECALLRLPSPRRRARAAPETTCRWWLAPRRTRDTPSS
jgi:hypothetical protein